MVEPIRVAAVRAGVLPALFVFLLASGCAGLRKVPTASGEKGPPVPRPVFFAADRSMEERGEWDSSVYVEEEVTLLAVGDLMFGRNVEEARKGAADVDPLCSVRDLLREADITFGNMECVLGRRGDFATWKSYDKIRLGAPTDSVRYLKASGFDVLSIGNNHSLDFGEEGLGSTARILREAGIGAVGIWHAVGRNEPVLVEVKGVRVAFLAYSDVSPSYFGAKSGKPGTIPPLPEIFARDIPAAKRAADRVVVSVHWGVEYQQVPTPKQRRTAHLMVDLGADVVLGHHPHVVQPFETYGKGFIAYSLGNFLFDLERPLAHESMVLKVDFRPGAPPRAEWAPVRIQEYIPVFLTGSEAETARRRFPRKLPIPAPAAVP